MKRVLEPAGWARIESYRAATTGLPTTRDYEVFADYHLRNLEGGGYPAFHAYPYRLAPLELLAIARRSGVFVSGEHPLIKSPLTRPRDVETLAVTDEMRPVIERAAHELGIESPGNACFAR